MAAIGVAGCSDDTDPTEPDPPEPGPHEVFVDGAVADDQTGDGVADASVMGEDADTGEEFFSVTTDSEGSYEAEFEVEDEPAEVRVEAEAEGYEVADVTVGFDDTMTANLNLTPEPQPDVVVEEASVEPSSAEIGETVTVTAYVQNHGNAAGDKALTFYVNGDAEDEKTVSVDPPGDGEGPEDTEVEAEFTWSTYDPDEYDLGVNEAEAGSVTMVSSNELELHSWEETRVDLAPGEYELIDTECPDGMALSGGVNVVGSRADEPQTRIQVSGLAHWNPPVAWAVGVSNRSTSEKSMDFHTICGWASEEFDLSGETVTLEAQSFEELSASCSREDQVVVSGGVRVEWDEEGEPDTRVQYSKPVSTDGGDEWRVGIFNQGYTDREATAFAVCSEAISGYTHVQDDFELPAGGYKRTISQCDEGQKVLGGGVSVVGSDGEEPNTRVRTEYPGTGGGGATYMWLTGISNESAEDLQVRSHAVCADY